MVGEEELRFYKDVREILREVRSKVHIEQLMSAKNKFNVEKHTET